MYQLNFLGKVTSIYRNAYSLHVTISDDLTGLKAEITIPNEFKNVPLLQCIDKEIFAKFVLPSAKTDE